MGGYSMHAYTSTHAYAWMHVNMPSRPLCPDLRLQRGQLPAVERGAEGSRLVWRRSQPEVKELAGLPALVGAA
jgi:hypothetical protein